MYAKQKLSLASNCEKLLIQHNIIRLHACTHERCTRIFTNTCAHACACMHNHMYMYTHVHDSTCIHGTSAICGMCWGFVVSSPHIVQYCDVLTQVDYSHWPNGTHAVTTCGRIGLVNSSMCEPYPIHVPMDLWCYIHVSTRIYVYKQLASKVSQYNTVHVLIKAPL